MSEKMRLEKENSDRKLKHRIEWHNAFSKVSSSPSFSLLVCQLNDLILFWLKLNQTDNRSQQK